MRVWVLALAGCGRIGFDLTAPGDGSGTEVTSAAHDEDGDGIDDALDGCPHVADPAQLDGDGDRVNDICDPQPTVARERIAYFDPFTSQRPEWMFPLEQPLHVGDGLAFDTLGSVYGVAALPLVPATDMFEWGGQISAGGAGPRQLAVLMAEDNDQYYYCELWDDGTSARHTYLYTLDGNTFNFVDSDTVDRPLENRDVRMRFSRTASTVSCATTWPMPAVQSITGAVPGIMAGEVQISALNLVARLDYFVQIRTE
jgi:hypothetical protein